MVKLGNPIDYYESSLMVTPDTILGKVHLTAGGSRAED